MKLLKILIIPAMLVSGMLFFMSADHIDAPGVTNMPTDVTDFYAFQSEENSNNLVFVANLSGLMSPAASGSAMFDENTLIEFNIDNNSDNVEDLVIQLIPRDGKMFAFGPFSPSSTSLSSSIMTAAASIDVDITPYGQSAIITSQDSKKLFAGVRDDPFFFDLGAYSSVLAGTATGFSNPGSDTFAGTNVLSVVFELPKSQLGNVDSINTWVETKVKQ
jgi:hypothetical protein